MCMTTTIYLIRHSEPFKTHIGNVNTTESILLENEKTPLSIDGEKMAEKFSLLPEFKDLDVIYSSNYARTMSTAKYFVHNNNLKVNIDERFNERIHGVDTWNELPINFEVNQLRNENYKIGYGESKKEVQARMYSALVSLISRYKGKKIAIISHATAITFLLSMFGEVAYNGDYTYKYKEIEYFNGDWNYLETFKLEFDENNVLQKITNIKNNN